MHFLSIILNKHKLKVMFGYVSFLFIKRLDPNHFSFFLICRLKQNNIVLWISYFLYTEPFASITIYNKLANLPSLYENNSYNFEVTCLPSHLAIPKPIPFCIHISIWPPIPKKNYAYIFSLSIYPSILLYQSMLLPISLLIKTTPIFSQPIYLQIKTYLSIYLSISISLSSSPNPLQHPRLLRYLLSISPSRNTRGSINTIPSFLTKTSEPSINKWWLISFLHLRPASQDTCLTGTPETCCWSSCF